MKPTKEEIYGFGSSLVICLLLLLVLSFVFLRTETRAEAEGIAVDFGTTEQARGDSEPERSGVEEETPVLRPVPEKPLRPVSPTPKPPVITQPTEPTAVVDAEEQRRKEERLEAERKRREEEQRRREEEQRRKDSINRQLSEAFGAGSVADGNQGRAVSGTGNQGSPQGLAASGSQTGAGGVGSFDLSGRSLRDGSLQRPAYDVQEEGTIVVEITVNPLGDVVQAEVRLRGTNIEDVRMRRSAIEAARRTRFNRIGGGQNQVGTITYRYSLK
jgi:TonB family protein